MKMTKRLVIQLLFVIGGVGLGFRFFPILWAVTGLAQNHIINNFLTNAVLGAIILYFLSFLLVGYLEKLVNRLEKYLAKQSPIYILFGSLGIIVGLVFAILISTVFFRTSWFVTNTLIPVVLMLLMGYLGFRIGTTRTDEWRRLFALGFRRNKRTSDTGEILDESEPNFHHYKILDTNILIDGRIYDIIKTGFLEGTLLVPNFVLHELQYIADSSDSIKRVRGRRGLDILNKLQSEKVMPIEMYEGDFEDIPEVDDKLIELAKQLQAVVVTNDYNLNKVSQFQNVQIMNINALAKSLKPRVIPGELLNVMVVKNGTERQQGVAYLDDGTMVVVEDGRYFINDHIDVTVTSALQTDAGRMIFAKPTHSTRGISDKATSGNSQATSESSSTQSQTAASNSAKASASSSAVDNTVDRTVRGTKAPAKKNYRTAKKRKN
ncbi:MULTISPECIES: PIN/TRAM domain-containing protein [Furfurilactobacillus]|uniref:PIN domain nuclease n=1 Tax=Furfurilactobacillus rossiae TaxID=231049 RepID=A0A7C9NAY4_9LACO|nr:PIN domain nuclease [Furfurilactobacillus milii]